MHTIWDQEKLKECAFLMKEKKANMDTLDIVISAIQLKSPELFHDADSLDKRVFADQPCQGEPCAGWLFDYKKRSERAMS